MDAPSACEQVVTAGDLLALHLGPQLVEQRRRGGDPDVGADERLFQGLPGRGVDAAGTQRGDRPAEQPADATQAAPVRGGASATSGGTAASGGAASGAASGGAAGGVGVGATVVGAGRLRRW